MIRTFIIKNKDKMRTRNEYFFNPLQPVEENDWQDQFHLNSQATALLKLRTDFA
jgi:hypothetical protein